jgi:hypothetical protein
MGCMSSPASVFLPFPMAARPAMLAGQSFRV